MHSFMLSLACRAAAKACLTPSSVRVSTGTRWESFLDEVRRPPLFLPALATQKHWPPRFHSTETRGHGSSSSMSASAMPSRWLPTAGCTGRGLSAAMRALGAGCASLSVLRNSSAPWKATVRASSVFIDGVKCLADTLSLPGSLTLTTNCLAFFFHTRLKPFRRLPPSSRYPSACLCWSIIRCAKRPKSSLDSGRAFSRIMSSTSIPS
mmetsp:Transcript_16773/g.40252  ORF Transcript_16773/g.40252 Transcript_16773/m.40252 type:complete len:208 (-) Transcript_16773:1085-1708(-)